jgi:hypothetical protein
MAGKGGGAQKAAKQARKLLKMDSSGAGLGDTADYGPVNGGTVNTSPGVLARDDPGNYNSSGTTPLATPPLKGKAKRQYLKTLPKAARPAAKNELRTQQVQFKRDAKYDRTIGTANNPVFSPVTRHIDSGDPSLGAGRPMGQMMGLGPYNDQALRLSYAGGTPPPGMPPPMPPGGPMPGFGGGGPPGMFGPPPGAPPPMLNAGGPMPGMPPGAGMAPPGMPPGPPPMMPPGMAAMPPNPFTPQPMQPMPWGGGDMTRQRFLAQLMGPGGPMAGMSA